MSLHPAVARPVASRVVVAVVALLVVAALVALFVAAAQRPDGPGAATLAPAPPDLREAVGRTLAAGSARIQGTYRPAHGPVVTITGRTSFAGPEAEVSAAVEGSPPALVRVTSAGAWLRAPGSDAWTPVAADGMAGVAAGRGWSALLRELDPATDVVTDDAGRIVRLWLARDRRGGSLDLRLSAFGTEVATAPP